MTSTEDAPRTETTDRSAEPPDLNAFRRELEALPQRRFRLVSRLSVGDERFAMTETETGRVWSGRVRRSSLRHLAIVLTGFAVGLSGLGWCVFHLDNGLSATLGGLVTVGLLAGLFRLRRAPAYEVTSGAQTSLLRARQVEETLSRRTWRVEAPSDDRLVGDPDKGYEWRSGAQLRFSVLVVPTQGGMAYAAGKAFAWFRPLARRDLEIAVRADAPCPLSDEELALFAVIHQSAWRARRDLLGAAGAIAEGAQ